MVNLGQLSMLDPPAAAAEGLLVQEGAEQGPVQQQPTLAAPTALEACLLAGKPYWDCSCFV
jgi:hypothetical protein